MRKSLLMGLDSPAGRRNGSSPEGAAYERAEGFRDRRPWRAGPVEPAFRGAGTPTHRRCCLGAEEAGRSHPRHHGAPNGLMNQYPTYGEVILFPDSAVVKHPESLSFTEAASIWMMFMTAYGALIADAKVT